jgi:hypothetical protein
VAERSPVSNLESGLQLPISTERIPMLNQEEIHTFEDELRNPVHDKIRDVPTLKKIIRDAVQALEKSLDNLPAKERETAYSLYLQKIRNLTFPFHLAVIAFTVRNQSRKESTREALQALLNWYREEFKRLSELYRYL